MRISSILSGVVAVAFCLAYAGNADAIQPRGVAKGAVKARVVVRQPARVAAVARVNANVRFVQPAVRFVPNIAVRQRVAFVPVGGFGFNSFGLGSSFVGSNFGSAGCANASFGLGSGFASASFGASDCGLPQVPVGFGFNALGAGGCGGAVPSAFGFGFNRFGGFGSRVNPFGGGFGYGGLRR